MRLFRFVQGVYRKYKLFMWLGTMGMTVAMPTVSYLITLARRYSRANVLMEDNPELASEAMTFSPIDWWNDHQNLIGMVMHWMLVVGLILVCMLAVVAISSMFQSHNDGKIGDASESDRLRRRKSTPADPYDDAVDDYGIDV